MKRPDLLLLIAIWEFITAFGALIGMFVQPCLQLGDTISCIRSTVAVNFGGSLHFRLQADILRTIISFAICTE